MPLVVPSLSAAGVGDIRMPRGMKYWPAELRPLSSVEIPGPSEEACAARAELVNLTKGFVGSRELASRQLPTESDVIRYRRKLHRVYNPVGWLLLDTSGPRSDGTR